MNKRICYITVLLLLLLTSCKDGSKETVVQETDEDKQAKSEMQGIWLNEDDEAVSMKIKGDSIFYADSTLAPVQFKVIADTLVLIGYNESRYPIIKREPHVLQFKNQTGDIVRLTKTDTPEAYASIFDAAPLPELNQNQLLKRDSVIMSGEEKFHIYIQVNPSRYKVVRSSLNADGVQTENVYYDNIINVCIYKGAQRLFSSNIYKKDLKKYVPADYLDQSILSDIIIDKVTTDDIQLIAQVCVPDSPTFYSIRLKVSKNGKLTMSGE